MSSEKLQDRTMQFAIAVIQLVENIPPSGASDVLGPKLLQAGTSVAANFRAACRTRSSKEYVAKLDAVEDEIDASIFLMELLFESGKIKEEDARKLIAEANELLNLIVASAKTTKLP